LEENVESEPARHRVEIVHESLLASWPRLVGWQTQDADAARVRDELRQAARTWDDHDRTTSLLWTGAAYREFRLWHNRYPGGLTQVEDDFATAMIGHAKWRKRRRRITVAVALLLALVVTGVTTVLWRRSVAHGRRAEAQKLIAIGQVQLEDYPTAALAYATRSLEIADSDAARILALEALWMGPTSFTVNDEISYDAQFSPDGQRLVGATRHRLRIVEADGPSSLLDDVHANKVVNFGISPGSEIVCSFDQGGLDESSRLVMWSVLDGRQLAEVKFEEATRLTHFICGDQRALAVVVEDDLRHVDAVYSDGSSERLGTLDILNMTRLDIAVRSGRWIGLAVGEEIFVVEIDENTVSAARSLGRHRGLITSLRVDPDGRFLASADADGRIMIWDPLGQSPPLAIRGPKGGQDFFIRFSDDGALMEAVSIDSEKLGESWVWSVDTDEPRSLRRVKLGLVFDTGGWEWDSPRPRLVKSGPDLKTRLWPVGVPADAEPLELKRGKDGILWEPSFHPDGDWLVTASHNGMAAWPLARPYASIIRRHDQVLYGLVFGPQGDWVASSSMDGTVKLWPLIGEAPAKGRVLHAPPERPQMLDLAVSPSGDRLLVGAGWSGAQLISIEGGEPRIFPGFESQVWGVAFSPDGRLVAAVGGEWEPREKKIRVWDAASGEEVVALGPNENLRPFDLAFIDEDHILSGGNTGLMKWNLETRDHEMVFEDPAFRWAVSADRRRVVAVNQPDVNQIWGWRAVLLDLESGRQTLLETHGNQIRNAALSPTGDIVVTGDSQGIIRVGPATGDEPHLLFGHDQVVEAVAIDPLGRWIASTGEDTTVRLWPMPDLSKPPLHTLPHDELIAKLKTLTNLRVVRDEQSATGWKLTHDPFPGWETVPEW
jgi:WD40 repeat protein